MIVVENLSKYYAKHLAVDNISFNINQGEIVGFLGPNGAGKTSTIRILTGYLPPSSGHASIGGFDVVKKSLEARRLLGYLPENVPLYDDLRVYEYLRYLGKLKGLSSRQLRAAMGEAIDKCGLGNVYKKMIKTLSKGYRQRTGLAGAIIAKPGILILDEPTNGLDPNQIRQIRELIKSLSSEITIMLSTHILSEVEMICNKVIIIDQGKIKANDTPANLTANLRAAGKISLEIKASEQQLQEQFLSLEQLKKVIIEEQLEDGWLSVTTRAEVGSDARQHIAELCSRNNWPLRSLYRHQPSLEDVFVELTRKD